MEYKKLQVSMLRRKVLVKRAFLNQYESRSCYCVLIVFFFFPKERTFSLMVGSRLPLVVINLSQMLRTCSNLASQLSKKVIFLPNGRFCSF